MIKIIIFSVDYDTLRSFDFKDEIIKVQKVILDQFLHLLHIELHLAATAGDQVRT